MTPQPATVERDARWLYDAIERGEVPQVIDLRNPEDAAGAALEAGRPVEIRNVALWHALDDVAGLAAGTADGVVLLCAKGNGSQLLAEELGTLGRQALSLRGGMAAWSELLVAVAVPTGRADLEVWQLQRPAKGCLSYLVGVPGDGCVVVDPARHLDPYLDLAAERGMEIRYVVDTHLHADHISGGPALAERTGARYSLPAADSGAVPWEVAGLSDGSPLLLGPNATAEALVVHLPGHTPGTTAIHLPGVCLIAGDTAFVRGVGRPDLTGQAESLARELYRSVHDRLASLDPATRLLPAHWSSMAERAADGTVSAPLEAVLASDLLSRLDEAGFVDRVLASLPAAPAAYDQIRRVNAGELASADELELLDVGRNQCAASGTV